MVAHWLYWLGVVSFMLVVVVVVVLALWRGK